MLKLLVPRLAVNTIHDIEFSKLRQAGIRGIVLDLDNTIIPWNSAEICPKIVFLIKNLTDQGFKVCLLSNNGNNRVGKIANICGTPYVARALKPSQTGFRQAIATMGLTPAEVAVVGDQLFTDVLGGNRLGLYTIWVQPLTKKEFIGTKLTRQLEKLAIYILKLTGRIS